MIRVLNVTTVPVRTITTTHRSQGRGKPREVPVYGCNEVFRSVFCNGLSVACQKPDYVLISNITVLFHVGPRFENAKNLGVCHFLRNSTIMSGRGSTDFMRARYLQQNAAYLTSCCDREYFAYILRAPSFLIGDVKSALIDSSVKNYYPDWEMAAIRKLVREDLTRRDPLEHIIDLIQKASFTGPLSNSIYCEEDRVDQISAKHMSDFVNSHFKPGVCVFGSSGVPIDDLVSISDAVGGPTDKCKPCYRLSQFRAGYEYYDTGPRSQSTYIAFAVQGAGYCNFQACLTHAILASALGHGNVTSSQHLQDRIIHKPIGSLIEPVLCNVWMSAFNFSFFETGIFGIIVKTTSELARCMGFRASEFLYNIRSITPEQVCLGKKRLLLGLILQDHMVANKALNQAVQPPAHGFENARDLCGAIAGIAVSDVIGLAQCIANKRCRCMSMAVLGDVEAAPHDAELRCGPSA